MEPPSGLGSAGAPVAASRPSAADFRPPLRVEKPMTRQAVNFIIRPPHAGRETPVGL